MAKTLVPESISDDALGNFVVGGSVVGYTIKVGVTRYRSMPLSCIEEFELMVDGKKIDPLDIMFCLNGKRFMISQLKDMYTEYWNINAKAELAVLKAGGLGAGEHEINLRLIMRVPYVYANDTYDIKRSEAEHFAFAKEDASCAARVALRS